MAKQPEEMNDMERMLFDLYADLEYAIVQEYDMMDAENVSVHLKGAVKVWSTTLHELGLLGDFYHEQAQKMADGTWYADY